MKHDVLRQLEDYFKASPGLRGMPATEAAIEAAQQCLNCRFVPEYVEFLRLFGCGILGPNPIFGIGAYAVDAMGAEDEVVVQTQRFRA